MASLSLGWISSPTCYSSPRNRANCHVVGSNRVMMMTTGSMKPSPPLLMLPPVLEEGGDMVYKFKTLADDDDRILSFNKRLGGADSDQIPPDDAKLVGSSHGWLALYDNKSNQVFLSNPISGQHIKLPPCDNGIYGRVFLSSSPDQEDCRAITVFPPAFCVPRVSTEWTLLDAECFHYSDFAYCSRRKLFSFFRGVEFKFDSECIGVLEGKYQRDPHHQIEDWDLFKGGRTETTWFWKYEGPPYAWKENEDVEFLTKHCKQRLRLVYAEDHFDLPLIVVWFTAHNQSTAGFVVVQIQKYGEGCTKGCIKAVEDLKGLAIFVGEKNQSFAIPASDFPGILNPNSIYFALGYANYRVETSDVGIFDYEKKTISPICDPNTNFFFLGRNVQDLMWLSPNLC